MFSFLELDKAYQEAGSMKGAGVLLGISKTKFRQQYLYSKNLCIQCTESLDKDGLICSKCLVINRKKVQDKLPKTKNCKQCSKEIIRTTDCNISWTKQKLCFDCSEFNDSECEKKHYRRNRKKKSEYGKTPEVKEYQKYYRKTSDGKMAKRISNEKRRAQKAATEIEDVSDHIKYLFTFQDFCWYCNAQHDLQIEHMIPLSRNGTHTKDNLVLACKKCNTTKGSKTPEEFYQYLGDT